MLRRLHIAICKVHTLVHCFWGRLIVNIGAEEKEGQFPWELLESFQEIMSHLAPKPLLSIRTKLVEF